MDSGTRAWPRRRPPGPVGWCRWRRGCHDGARRRWKAVSRCATAMSPPRQDAAGYPWIERRVKARRADLCLDRDLVDIVRGMACPLVDRPDRLGARRLRQTEHHPAVGIGPGVLEVHPLLV